MPSSVECRARAAEYDRKAEASANAGVRQFYHSLAQHWRSLALLAEAKAEREQSAGSGPRVSAPNRLARFLEREERQRVARTKRGGMGE
jgi:imidazolonepropionase-like amidohydrolase